MKPHCLTFVLLLLGMPPMIMAGSEVSAAATAIDNAQQSALSKVDKTPLLEKVRRATARYRDINVAISEGWVRGTPCVSGPDAGAMGVHFVMPERIGDGVLNAHAPEALIYEPMSGGAMRLVGIEFIVLAKDWARLHPDGSTPELEGNLLNYIGEPNRFGLPAFYELHVWAWEDNPHGSFADWNTLVSCEKQPGGA